MAMAFETATMAHRTSIPMAIALATLSLPAQAAADDARVAGQVASVGADSDIVISRSKKGEIEAREAFQLVDCDLIEVFGGSITIRLTNDDVVRVVAVAQSDERPGMFTEESPYLVRAVAPGHGNAVKELPIAGYVESFGPDPHAYGVRRGHEPPPAESDRPLDRPELLEELHRPKLLEELRHCDQVAVKKGAAPLVIRLSTNEKVEIPASVDCREDGAVCLYTVRADVIAPTMVSNLFSGLLRMIGGRHEYERHVLTLGIRGDEPLDLPLLWADENDVVEGQRALALSWIGGEAPFAVEIGPEGGAPVVSKEGVSGQALEPARVELAAGEWRVLVRDAGGETVEGAFTVVPGSELPAVPPDAGLEALPQVLGEAAYAAWLAEQDEGRWLYEAYLRAGALAGAFAPAGYLERYLASGALWQ